MAKINFGPVVNDARGKTNGIVYSKNKSGAYVRTKVTPSNPRTIYQQEARSILAELSQGWSGTLTAAQRADWTSFANTYPIRDIFGNSIKLNGLNMYVRVNAVLSQIAASLLTAPPASPATTPIPVDPTVFTVTAPDILTFTQTAAAPTAGTLFYLFATPGLPAGRNPTQSDYRLIGTQTAATTGFPASILAGSLFITRMGSIITGLKYSLLVSTVDPTVGIPTVAMPFQGIAT